MHGSAPFGHWGTSIFMATLRHDGPTRLGSWTARSTETPSGSMSKRSWRRSIAATPSSWTIWAATRPKRCARRSEARVPVFCYFRPAAPISNPIKQAFAKLKHFLRRDQPRNQDDLWKNVGSILEKFTPEECSNDLANSGYKVGQTK